MKTLRSYEPSEKDILKQIRGWLNWNRVFYWRNIGGLGHPVGLPDIQGILPGGRHFDIEVKKPGHKLTEHQQRYMDKAQELGALSFVAYSLEDVIDRLKNEIK